MHDHLFTPVEVIRKQNECYSKEQLLRFRDPQLFQLTKPRIPSLADDRRQVIAWLKSLPYLQRSQAAAIYSPQFVAIVRGLTQKDESNEKPFKYYFYRDEGKFKIHKQPYYKQNVSLEKSLLQNVKIISQGRLFQALTIGEKFVEDIQALFEVLDHILQGLIFDYNNFQQQQRQSGKIRFQIQISMYQHKTLAEWVAELLLKQILLSYASKGSKIQPACKHIRMQEQQYSKLWRQLTLQQKEILLSKSLSKNIGELIEDYSNSVDVNWPQLPKIYIGRSKQENMKFMLGTHHKNIFSQLLYCTIEESLNSHEFYKIWLSLELQAYLNKLNSEGTKKKKKKKKNIDKIVATKPIQIIAKSKKQTQQQIYSSSSNFSTIDQKIQSPIVKETSSQNFIEKDDACKLKVSCDSNQIQMEQTKQQEQVDKKQSKEAQTNIIERFTKQIKEKNRDKYRKLILNRLIVLLSQYKLVCRPYGSYAAHLSLSDSDLDIQIDSSLLGYFYLDFLSERDKIISALDFLKKILEQESWTADFNIYTNARIPIITFKADAGIYLPTASSIKTKFKLNGKRSQKVEETIIQVDLSIQPYANMSEIPHNGLQATQMMKQWVENIPLFHSFALCLKAIIKRQNLHKAYEGGISSYCLTIFCAGFLKTTQINNQSSKDYYFDKLVKFIQDFHKEEKRIDILSEKIIEKNENGPVLVSPWDKRNLVQRAFRFGQIIQVLKNWKYYLSNEK